MLTSLDRLAFLGPPGKCTNVSGKSTDGNSMTLAVSQCLNSTVTEYKIFYRRVGSSEAWLSTIVTSPIVVSNLIPFTEYDFKVSAGNKHGYGPNSSTITVQTVEGGTWRLAYLICLCTIVLSPL